MIFYAFALVVFITHALDIPPRTCPLAVIKLADDFPVFKFREVFSVTSYIICDASNDKSFESFLEFCYGLANFFLLF
jgi:hypothetical protein